MAALIGITGEKKPAASLIDVLDVIRSLDIDVYYGDYARAVQRAGGLPVWIPGDAPPSILDRLDGLLLSGGDDIDPAEFGEEPHPMLGAPNPHRDAQERVLFGHALEIDLPVLGICRGPQLMNVHLGGSLHQHLPDHQAFGGPVDAIVHRVGFDEGSCLHQVYGGEVEVNSLHHQGLDRLGDGVVAVGRTIGGPDDGLVEAIEIEGKPALGVQWHPELLGGVDPALVWLVEAALSSSS
ncbi:MAG: gamma-glutamyl-gamma-aminobutyrate hydrolase family protein [Actinomycetota bacterium]